MGRYATPPATDSLTVVTAISIVQPTLPFVESDIESVLSSDDQLQTKIRIPCVSSAKDVDYVASARVFSIPSFRHCWYGQRI